ncbi:MAG: hypothetical protein S0880_19075 [Actinomycetota bacterium]|nr:hypothetical protein [Actinomycetota bacterium]
MSCEPIDVGAVSDDEAAAAARARNRRPLILDEGRLPTGSGFRARAARRRQLPGARAGTALVLVDRAGGPVAVDGGLTAAERYWARPVAWARVDIGERHSLCSVHVPDTDGGGGLSVELFVAWRVVDPLTVARLDIATAAEVLDATLTSRVRLAADLLGPLDDAAAAGERTHGGDTLGRLGAARRRLAAAVADLHDAELDTPGWLSARVLGVLVAFDESTQRHVDELLAARRRDEMRHQRAGPAPDPPGGRPEGATT